MNKELNNQCPACECFEVVYTDRDLKDDTYIVGCCECGFRMSVHLASAIKAVWAWETLPRPRKAKAKRKAKEAKP